MSPSTSPPQADHQSILSDPLITAATSFVRSYMSHYDASHDASHITRVVRLAYHIYTHTPPASPPLCLRTIILSALLHDVGDRKYLLPGQDGATLVRDTLRSLGCSPPLADRVQAICAGVSYSAEAADPARTAALVRRYPELAVVQDADRLDAVGAVGVGRMFAYGGAKLPKRSLAGGMGHVEEKLVKLEGLMKTEEGRRLARERTERLRVFRGWWEEETGFGEEGFAFEVGETGAETG